MSEIVNRRNIDFLLYDVLGLERLLSCERYADFDRSAINSILDMVQTLAEEEFLPSAAKLDANEPQFIDGKAVTIPEVKQALTAFREAGLFTSTFDVSDGGMQLPFVVSQAMNGMLMTANAPIVSYAFLTMSNAAMLKTCGSEALKQVYLPPMLEGRWFGTMCLSETQAGSSLSDIRTKAEPIGDGRYNVTGTKMWISGGDQDISENIVHMVLAKIPGAPAGVKGISLFLVPKFRVNDDGSLGEFNNVVLAGLNHKMGHRGTTNTLLNFGESGDCIGYLVGEENQGLANMFQMMNEARVGVGQGAVMSGLGGYLYSLEYARNRPQGRLPENKNPKSPQVMITEHADVKRMLMTQKAFVEGAQLLIYYCATLIDRQKVSSDQTERQRLSLLLEILTPIAKSWPSEYCLEANKLAIQVLGGYGYTREYPVERYYRDNRLNPIHEGAHGIHGIDILGRKVRMYEGAALVALEQEILATIATAKGCDGLQNYGQQLATALAQAKAATIAVDGCSDQTTALANATIFLDAFGHVVIAWMWLWQASVAMEKQGQVSENERSFCEGKLAACRFFFLYELPKVESQFALVASLDQTCVDLKTEHFIGE